MDYPGLLDRDYYSIPWKCVCGRNVPNATTPNGGNSTYVNCPTCGKYQTFVSHPTKLVPWSDYLAPYLFHTAHDPCADRRYKCFVDSVESEQFVKNLSSSVRVIYLQEVKNWYPKSFSEKIDKILLCLSFLSRFEGDIISMDDEQQLNSLLFLKRYVHERWTPVLSDDRNKQLMFVLQYLHENKLVSCGSENTLFHINPDGYARIDTIQKTQLDATTAFVAMQFGEKTKEVREAIHQAIIMAGYQAIIMDAIHHNKQIVPEILHQIRQCKFVVADLSDRNNGAYYEAGFAAGCGKEVIFVCHKKAFQKKAHFDVKQIATVLWESPAELIELLTRRIEATIGFNPKH